jgi:type II secretion system protein J
MKLNPHNLRAFTLIEMILAIGISALVLVAIGSVFFAGLRLRDATQAAVDKMTPVDQTLSVLRRDLECVVTPTNGTSGILSGDFRVGTVASSGIAQPVAIEMYTATGDLSQSEPWGDIQKVTYELEDSTGGSPGKDLVRSVTRNLLPLTATPNVDNQWMMGGVASIQFSCFDGSQWYDTWDTTGVNSANTNLPVAVRVMIQMVGNGNGDAQSQPIELLVPIDSQSLTNTNASTSTST